jgi:hypothetical protein
MRAPDRPHPGAKFITIECIKTPGQGEDIVNGAAGFPQESYLLPQSRGPLLANSQNLLVIAKSVQDTLYRHCFKTFHVLILVSADQGRLADTADPPFHLLGATTTLFMHSPL